MIDIGYMFPHIFSGLSFFSLVPITIFSWYRNLVVSTCLIFYYIYHKFHNDFPSNCNIHVSTNIIE
jgi:hypothetical protein